VGRVGEYRYEVSTVEGFVQQLAVSYLKNRYWFYVQGEVPEGKDPLAVDEKLLTRYEIAQSKWAKLRAVKRGEAKLQYLRYRTTFLLLATHGEHRFFECERENIRDARERPVRFYGYSVGYRDGHPHVRISSVQYRAITDAFLGVALSTPADSLAAQFRSLPFEPYGPVKVQLKRLLFKVNRVRRTAGLERVPASCLRTKRRTVRPFATGGQSSSFPAPGSGFTATGRTAALPK
jgi:hypothetical protein